MAAEFTPLRIAFTPHAYLPAVGGAERYTQGLAEALAANGHDVHVAVADIDNPEAFYELGHRGTGRGNETIGGVSIHRLPCLLWRYRAASLLRWQPEAALDSALSTYARSLTAALHGISPDVVVTLPHLFRQVPAAFDAARACGAALVYAPFLHESDPNWQFATVARYVKDADATISLTEGERTRLIEAYGASSSRTANIPPAVDLPADRSDVERLPMVLYMGRLTASKRLEVLADAMLIVRDKFPEVELVLAGARDAHWQPPREQDGIRIVENPADEESDRLFASAHVFASPSLNESFGITTLEAWAHQTPVVRPATPVSEAIVTNGTDGLLTAPDSSAMAAGIVALLSDRERARLMGIAGRKVVSERFSWNVSARAFQSLAKKALVHNKRRS